MSRIVLDAGALISLERNDREMWAVLKLAAIRSTDVLVPSVALAQVWRGSRRQALLGRALDHCLVAAFDPVAREVGELCGRARTTDICDAHVAIVATTHAEVFYTSDPKDMERLIAACHGRRPIVVAC